MGKKEILGLITILLISFKSAYSTELTPSYPKEPQEIFQAVSPAIVDIINKKEECSASGFVIDKEGIIVTNYHVMSSNKDVRVRLNNGKIYSISGIVYFDAKRDVCILKIEANDLPIVSIGDSNNIQIGERVYAIGNPLGLEHSFSEGLLSGVRDFNNLKWLQFTAFAYPGNSGGPLVNSKGEVIGIVTAGIEPGKNINFAIPINEIKTFINKNIKINFQQFTNMPPEGYKYFLQGYLECLKRNFKEALTYYNKAIEINPSYAEAYNDRGCVFQQLGNLDESLSDYNKAVDINPNLANPYLNRGNIFYKKGNYYQALSDYSKAIQINPKYEEAYFNRAAIFLELSIPGKAISDYNTLLEINPSNMEAYYNRGLSYFLKEEYNNAEKDFEKSESLGYKVPAELKERVKKSQGNKN